MATGPSALPLDWTGWALIALVYLAAGLVKGVVGLGLPSVAVGLGSLLVGMKPAIALLLLPSFVTNVWQAADGRALAAILRRTWPMMLAILAGTWAGVWLLSRLDPRTAMLVMGLTLVGYALMGFTRPHLPHPGRHERALSIPVGAVHGVVAGMTGSYIPAVPFLQSLALGKDVLVQAMGVLFTASTIALALAMLDHRLVTGELALASAAAVLPALAGMWLGQRVRNRLSEARFKQALLAALGALGAYMVWRTIAG